MHFLYSSTILHLFHGKSRTPSRNRFSFVSNWVNRWREFINQSQSSEGEQKPSSISVGSRLIFSLPSYFWFVLFFDQLIPLFFKWRSNLRTWRCFWGDHRHRISQMNSRCWTCCGNIMKRQRITLLLQESFLNSLKNKGNYYFNFNTFRTRVKVSLMDLAAVKTLTFWANTNIFRPPLPRPILPFPFYPPFQRVLLKKCRNCSFHTAVGGNGQKLWISTLFNLCDQGCRSQASFWWLASSVLLPRAAINFD